ncbi:MAG: hypothetical protein BJ554DRAFT_6899, partial [Olpidium bornovanus]
MNQSYADASWPLASGHVRAVCIRSNHHLHTPEVPPAAERRRLPLSGNRQTHPPRLLGFPPSRPPLDGTVVCTAAVGARPARAAFRDGLCRRAAVVVAPGGALKRLRAGATAPGAGADGRPGPAAAASGCGKLVAAEVAEFAGIGAAAVFRPAAPAPFVVLLVSPLPPFSPGPTPSSSPSSAPSSASSPRPPRSSLGGAAGGKVSRGISRRRRPVVPAVCHFARAERARPGRIAVRRPSPFCVRAGLFLASHVTTAVSAFPSPLPTHAATGRRDPPPPLPGLGAAREGHDGIVRAPVSPPCAAISSHRGVVGLRRAQEPVPLARARRRSSAPPHQQSSGPRRGGPSHTPRVTHANQWAWKMMTRAFSLDEELSEKCPLNNPLARTFLGAVPKYNRTGRAPALNDFVDKLEMAARISEETLDLAANRLTGQAAVLPYHGISPKGAPASRNGKVYGDNTAKLLKRSSKIHRGVQHIIPYGTPRRCPEERHANDTCIERPRGVQEAARRDFRVTTCGVTKKASSLPINWAGATGEIAKNDLKKVRCFNCGRKGHMAQNCRSPKKEKTKRGEPALKFEGPKKPRESGLQVTCTAGIIKGKVDPQDGAVRASDRRTRMTVDRGATRHMIPDASWFSTSQLSNKMPLFSVPATTYHSLDILFKADRHTLILQAGKVAATSTSDDHDRLFYLDGTVNVADSGGAATDNDTDPDFAIRTNGVDGSALTVTIKSDIDQIWNSATLPPYAHSPRASHFTTALRCPPVAPPSAARRATFGCPAPVKRHPVPARRATFGRPAPAKRHPVPARRVTFGCPAPAKRHPVPARHAAFGHLSRHLRPPRSRQAPSGARRRAYSCASPRMPYGSVYMLDEYFHEHNCATADGRGVPDCAVARPSNRPSTDATEGGRRAKAGAGQRAAGEGRRAKGERRSKGGSGGGGIEGRTAP